MDFSELISEDGSGLSVNAGALSFEEVFSEFLKTLGNPDPSIRDGANLAWFSGVIEGGRLGERELVDVLSKLVSCTSDASEFKRSFSFLALSMLLHSDKEAWLDESTLDELSDSAIATLLIKADTRAYTEEFGWVHEVAHIADLLLSIAIHPSFKNYAWMLSSVLGYLKGRTLPFSGGEDARFGAVIAALVMRIDQEVAIDTVLDAVERDYFVKPYFHNMQATLRAAEYYLIHTGHFSSSKSEGLQLVIQQITGLGQALEKLMPGKVILHRE